VTLLKEMLSGHDLIAYLDFSPASYIFTHLPRILRPGTKTILHVEGVGAELESALRMLSFLYHGVIPNCDSYTAITECVARAISPHIPHPPKYVLPVGVDLSSFSPRVARRDSDTTVLFAATVMENKRPLLVVEAAGHFPEVKFRLVGPGRHGYEKVVGQRIHELGLCNVSLDGPKSQTELAEVMKQSDVFILPSQSEGLPRVTLEAAASGLPCVVFLDYETPSVVDGVTGFQVATVEEMLEKLGLLIADAGLRKTMGQAARKHAEQFDWNLVSRHWEEAYLSIAAGK